MTSLNFNAKISSGGGFNWINKATLVEIYSLNPVQFKILIKFLDMCNEEGVVFLNAGVKRIIIKELQLGKSTLDNSLSLMTKATILNRVDTGIYQIKKNIVELCK